MIICFGQTSIGSSEHSEVGLYQLGDNVCGIETAYRYLYRQVLYGDVGSVRLIKDGDTLIGEPWNKGQKEYRLIVSEFGKYFWDERPQVLQL